MPVAGVCELAVVCWALLQALDSNGAEISRVGCVVSEHGRPPCDKTVNQARHLDYAANTNNLGVHQLDEAAGRTAAQARTAGNRCWEPRAAEAVRPKEEVRRKQLSEVS